MPVILQERDRVDELRFIELYLIQIEIVLYLILVSLTPNELMIWGVIFYRCKSQQNSPISSVESHKLEWLMAKRLDSK